MPMRHLLWSMLLIVPSLAMGQQPSASTAQEGQLLPAPFPAYAVIGPRAKNVHCLFVSRDLNPTVAVIALKQPTKPTEPLSQLLQKLEAKTAENPGSHFGSFAIFLTLDKPIVEDPTGGAAVAAAESLAKDLKLKECVIGVEHLDKGPLAAFGIDKEKHEITILVYNRHLVAKRYTFTKDKPLADANVAEILAEADKILPKKK